MPSDESKGSQLDAIGSLAPRQLDNTFTSHQRMFVDGNIFPAIAVGRLEWSFRFLAGNDQKESKTGP